MRKFHLPRKFQRETHGVSAVEFALLAPLFFAIIFAILELLVLLLAQIWLDNGLQRVGEMMEAKRDNGEAFSIADIRTELCSQTFGIGLISQNCSEGKMRIGVWYSGRLQGRTTDYPDEVNLGLPNDYITPGIDTKWGDVWIVAIKLNWPFHLPTTKLIQLYSSGTQQTADATPELIALRTLVVPRKLVEQPKERSSMWQ